MATTLGGGVRLTKVVPPISKITDWLKDRQLCALTHLAREDFGRQQRGFGGNDAGTCIQQLLAAPCSPGCSSDNLYTEQLGKHIGQIAKEYSPQILPAQRLVSGGSGVRAGLKLQFSGVNEQPRSYSGGTCIVAVSGTAIGAGPDAGAGAGAATCGWGLGC
jgi:hypothetical protein